MYDFKLEYTFSDDSLADIDRQLNPLLTTRAGTMPLDRDFGLTMDYLDRPAAVAKSLYVAELVEKVGTFLPAIRVREVKWQAGADGRVLAKVVIDRA